MPMAGVYTRHVSYFPVKLAACAAAIAISSKFLIRYRGKHVFNPANVAIVLMMLASEHVWVSSGQWGSTATG